MSLTIRFPEEGDAEAVFEAVRESIEPLHRWMDWCSLDFGVEHALSWITAQREARSSGNAFEFVIVEDDRVLGACGINGVVGHIANLGYWVRLSATRRGIATSAVGMVADWAFAHTDVQRLEIVVAEDNAASLGVAARVGAIREGLLRGRLRIHGTLHDAVMHSILRSSWPSAAGDRSG
jgi:ribosomal-protein-serine acetyltransferase